MGGLDDLRRLLTVRGITELGTALQRAGGFGLVVPVEDSFDWLTTLLTDGIRRRAGVRG